MRQMSKRKYKLRLPVEVYGPNRMPAKGATSYISHSEIRFVLDDSAAVKLDTEVTLLVALPPEITPGSEVVIRAQATIDSIAWLSGTDMDRLAFTAEIKRYEFIRKGRSLTPSRLAGRPDSHIHC
jgi:hypothetical protein